MNTVTNKIYVATSGGFSVINGANNAITSVTAASNGNAVAVNPATNRIYVALSGGSIAVVDGISNTILSNVTTSGSHLDGVAANPATSTAWVTDGTALTTTVISEATSAVPLTAVITALSANTTFVTTPSMSFTGTSTFSPNAPAIQDVRFQVDTWQGAWTSSAPSPFTGVTGTLQAGLHTIYAYATDSQVAQSTQIGSPLIGSITAYLFLADPPARASQLSAGTPQSANANAGYGTALAVTVTDSGGAPLSGVSVTFTAPSTGASGTFSVSSTVSTTVNTNSSGVATASAFTANSISGSFSVTATVSGLTSASFSLTNGALNQSITFNALPGKTYGAAAFGVSATATSSLSVSFTSTTTPVCTVTSNGSALTIVAAGNCSITASQGGNSTYAAALNAIQAFTVAKVALAVTVANAAKNYGAALPTLSTSSVSGLVNGDTVGTTITIGLSTTATAASAVSGGTGAGGAYPISATVGGTASGDYTLTNNPGLLTVNAVGLTVIVANASKSYGAALPTFSTSSVSGLVNGDTVGATITISLSTTATAASAVGGGGGAGGAYPITAIVGGTASGNYTLTNTPGLLTVNPVGLTCNGSREHQQELRCRVTCSVDEQRERPRERRHRRNHDYDPSLSTTATMSSAVGGYPITATVGGASSGNYTLINTPGLLTVNAVGLTVTVASGSKNYGAAVPALTTSSVTGLVNGDTVGTTITISLSTTATAASAVGGYPITATVGGASSGTYTRLDVNTPRTADG